MFRDISANSIQTFFNQGLGILIFYMTSKYLVKEEFGELNWCLAVGSTIIAVMSLGLDLVFVKRVAAGNDPLSMAGMHLFHTVASGILLTAVFFALRWWYAPFQNAHPLFLLVYIQLTIANIANSYKLFLNGLEAYRDLALVSVIANTIKLTGVVFLALTGLFALESLLAVYILVSALEAVFGYAVLRVRSQLRVRPKLKPLDYRDFILESLPQLGVVIFDSALARIDWIMLGVLSTTVITAEYSFAYKVFELSRLPLVIIAPVLLTRFSKLFGASSDPGPDSMLKIRKLFRLQMFLVLIIPVALVSSWKPLIEAVTGGKYGASNELTFRLLSLCVPMLSIINFIWTYLFAKGRLKNIMYITIVVSLVNIGANFFLIPIYGADGAAVAFLVSTLVQTALYLLQMIRTGMMPSPMQYLPALVSAVVAIGAATYLSNHAIFAAIISLIIYTLLCFITRQLKWNEISELVRNKTLG